MPKKPTLTPDESDEFRNAMEGTKPLKKQPKHTHTPPPNTPKKHSETPPPAPTFGPIDPSDFDQTQWVDGEDSLHFNKTGLQRKTLTRLKRGTVNIEARVDLHRLTADEALNTVDRFIQHCQAEGIRWALIVHGKGHFSTTDKPILKNILNEHLRHHRSVLAFHSAKPKDGGTGAVYVLLKHA